MSLLFGGMDKHSFHGFPLSRAAVFSVDAGDLHLAVDRGAISASRSRKESEKSKNLNFL